MFPNHDNKLLQWLLMKILYIFLFLDFSKCSCLYMCRLDFKPVSTVLRIWALADWGRTVTTTWCYDRQTHLSAGYLPWQSVHSLHIALHPLGSPCKPHTAPLLIKAALDFDQPICQTWVWSVSPVREIRTQFWGRFNRGQ